MNANSSAGSACANAEGMYIGGAWRAEGVLWRITTLTRACCVGLAPHALPYLPRSEPIFRAKDQDVLRHQLTLLVLDDTFAICKLGSKEAIPAWATVGAFFSVT